MDRRMTAWDRLLPRTGSALVRARAGLVIGTCLSIVLACAMLLLTWLISGDLQWETAVAALVLAAVLAGIAAVARSGRVAAATGLLVSLLLLLVAVDVWSYGVASSASAAFTIPIVLAACGLGFWPGLAVAGLSAGVVWLSAQAATAGWYVPLTSPDISNLTFDAPALTVIFLVVALVAGAWTRFLVRQGG